MLNAFPPPSKKAAVMFPVEYKPYRVPTLVMFDAFTLYSADPSPDSSNPPDTVIRGGGDLSMML